MHGERRRWTGYEGLFPGEMFEGYMGRGERKVFLGRNRVEYVCGKNIFVEGGNVNFDRLAFWRVLIEDLKGNGE